jgi:hypothetical protein
MPAKGKAQKEKLPEGTIIIEQKFNCDDKTKVRVKFYCTVKSEENKELELIMILGGQEVMDKTVTNLTLPSTYNNYTITSIGTSVCKLNYELKRTEKDVISFDCNSKKKAQAKSIIIPDTITYIEKEAFKGAYISKVSWSANCKTIMPFTFSESTLESITGLESVTNIKNGAFFVCKNLAKVGPIPSCKEIEAATFAYCSLLKEFNWPEQVEVIPDECFSGCLVLSELGGIDKVAQIGEYALKETLIKEFTVPNTCRSVSAHCFLSCSKLRTVTWSNDCLEIPDGCFMGCSSLKNIKNISHITSIEREAFCNTGFTKFTWPEECAIIPEACFSDSKNLKEIKITTSVIKISKKAFWNTAMETLDLSQCLCADLDEKIVPEGTEIKLPFYA